MSEELDRERARQAAMLFVANTRRHKRLLRKFVSELGICHSQHRLLMHLHRMECAPSQTELAHTFEVSTAAIAVSLKKLETGGYIRRCAAVEDSRYNEIAITDKGEELIRQTESIFTSADVAMFSDFSAEELESFISGMEKMKTAMKQFEEGGREVPRLKGIHVREFLAGAGNQSK